MQLIFMDFYFYAIVFFYFHAICFGQLMKMVMQNSVSLCKPLLAVSGVKCDMLS